MVRDDADLRAPPGPQGGADPRRLLEGLALPAGARPAGRGPAAAAALRRRLARRPLPAAPAGARTRGGRRPARGPLLRGPRPRGDGRGRPRRGAVSDDGALRGDNGQVLSRGMAALLVAEIVSSLGSLMSVVALPWFVLQTTGSPSRMAAVLAAEAAPLALLGVPSGRAAGALGARRTLLACDLVWAPAMAAIPLLHFAGALSFPVLLTLAVAAGLPWAAHHGSQAAVLPELLGEEPTTIGRARALLQTAGRVTYFAGPVLGGLLLAAIGAPAVLLVDAGTFAVSFALVAALVPATPPATAEPRGRGGPGVIARDPGLRRLT